MSDNTSMKSLLAYEKIRNMILTGQKGPGTRLVIADLVEETGIGKGAIRDAIMRLDRSGLVKNIPYKGAEVAMPPLPEEIRYIYQLRKDLESTLAVTALENITDSDIEHLEELLEKMTETPQDNYYNLDLEFHHYIYDVAHRPHLHNIANAYIFSVESVLNIYLREAKHVVTFNAQHAEIVEAIKLQDPELVRLKMTKNIESGLANIKDTYVNIMNRPFE